MCFSLFNDILKLLCQVLSLFPFLLLFTDERLCGGISYIWLLISDETCQDLITCIFSFSLCQVWFDSQVDELLKQRDTIHSTFTVSRSLNISANGSNLSNGSTSKIAGEDSKVESPREDGGSDGKDKSGKKKWFNLNLKG